MGRSEGCVECEGVSKLSRGGYYQRQSKQSTSYIIGIGMGQKICKPKALNLLDLSRGYCGYYDTTT